MNDIMIDIKHMISDVFDHGTIVAIFGTWLTISLKDTSTIISIIVGLLTIIHLGFNLYPNIKSLYRKYKKRH